MTGKRIVGRPSDGNLTRARPLDTAITIGIEAAFGGLAHDKTMDDAKQ